MPVEDGHDGHAFLLGADQRLEMRPRPAESAVEAVGARHHEHAGEHAGGAEPAARLHGLGDHRPRREDVHRVVLGIPAGLPASIHEPVAALQDLRPVLGRRRRSQRLIHRLGRETEVEALALVPARERPQSVHQDPLDLLREGRVEVADPRQRDADPRRDHRLMRAALGREADAGRRRDHDELAARVERVIERIEATVDEGIVEGPDGKEGQARELVRLAEGAQGEEEIVLGDPQLDVLAFGGLLPPDGLRHALEGVGLGAREVDALAVDPRREMGRHGDVGRDRDDPVSDRQAGESTQDAAEGLLGRAGRGVGLAELLGNLRHPGGRRPGRGPR